jgi:hypothetical protein
LSLGVILDYTIIYYILLYIIILLSYIISYTILFSSLLFPSIISSPLPILPFSSSYLISFQYSIISLPSPLLIYLLLIPFPIFILYLSVLTYTYLYSSPPNPSSSSFPIILPNTPSQHLIHSILVGTYIYLFIFQTHLQI